MALFFCFPAMVMAMFGEPPPPPDPATDAAYNLLRVGEASIKQSLRNPASYETVNALFSRKTGSVCIEYRAENGFGGMNVEHAIVPRKGNIITNPKPTKIMKECGEAAERLY